MFQFEITNLIPAGVKQKAIDSMVDVVAEQAQKFAGETEVDFLWSARVRRKPGWFYGRGDGPVFFINTKANHVG